MGVTLTVVGVACLAAFAWFVWPPLVLLVAAGSAISSGLLIDWEVVRGEPTDTPPRKE